MLRMVVGLLVLASLASCSFPATQMYLNQNRNLNLNLDGIRTIALTEIEEPANYEVRSLALIHYIPDPDLTFGGLRVNRTMFSELMATQNLHVGQELQSAVAQAMQRNGYDIMTVKISHPDQRTLLRPEDLPAINADALLDVIIWGVPAYEDSLFGAAFAPIFGLQAQLIDAKTGKIIYSERVLYGEGNRMAFVLSVDRRFRFSSYDAMQRDPALVAQGLRDAIPLLSNTVGMQLSKTRSTMGNQRR